MTQCNHDVNVLVLKAINIFRKTSFKLTSMHNLTLFGKIKKKPKKTELDSYNFDVR